MVFVPFWEMSIGGTRQTEAMELSWRVHAPAQEEVGRLILLTPPFAGKSEKLESFLALIGEFACDYIYIYTYIHLALSSVSPVAVIHS